MAVTPSQLRSYANLAPQAVVPDSTLQQYCDAAALIVLEDLAASGLSNDRLGLIELNLAAHFAMIGQERGGLRSQVIGSSEELYNNDTGSAAGLGASLFGQIAIGLDNSGSLSKQAANPVRARFEVVGTQGSLFPESEMGGV